MLKENEVKVLTPPSDKANGLNSNYLIQNVDDYNFLIHRELKQDEALNYEKDEVFDYEGKKYLFCIANAPTERHAELAVESYWKAASELENFIKMKSFQDDNSN